MNPLYLLAAGGAAEGLGGLMARSNQKRANRANMRLRQGALSNVDLAGSTARQDTAEAFGNQQSGLVNRLAERGLTGSTAQDAALNANLGQRQQAMSRINEGVAREKNAVMGQFQTEASPYNPLMGVGSLLGQGANYLAADQARQRETSALEKLAGVAGADRVTKEQLNGGGVRAKLSGGGNWWDWVLRNHGS